MNKHRELSGIETLKEFFYITTCFLFMVYSSHIEEEVIGLSMIFIYYVAVTRNLITSFSASIMMWITFGFNFFGVI